MPRRRSEFWYDEEEADRVCRFFEGVLKHTKGIYARQPFLLRDWQREGIIAPLYGWMRWDAQYDMAVRRYSTAWIELGRGNGKSELAAGIALEGLCADGEEGAEIYGAAEDREQAAIVYRVAKRMVELSPTLSKRLRVFDSAKRIVDPRTDSFYQALPRDQMGEGSQGFNPHVVVFDEVHVQKNRALLDALKRGMGKRVQPLLVMVTTAGNNPTSPAAEEHEYSRKVLEGEAEDPHRLVYMRNTPKDADAFVEKNWYEANPALGDFLSIETLRQEAREAQGKPTEENSFRQYRLNQWVQQRTRWMPLHRWDATAGTVNEDALKGMACYGGLDLASSVDVAALCWDFPDGEEHQAIWRFWVPEAQMSALDKRTGGQASVWVKDGFLTPTEGEVIDYKAVLARIDADASRFDVAELAYDPWGMTQLSQDLDAAGMTMVQMRQGFQSMSSPIKEWQRLIYAGRYHHGGNPVMRWMVDNIVVRTDPAGNLKIDKERSHEKVDGAVAAVMALARAQYHGNRKPRAAYFF